MLLLMFLRQLSASRRPESERRTCLGPLSRDSHPSQDALCGIWPRRLRAPEVAKAVLQKRSHGTDSRRHGRGGGGRGTSKYGPGGARQPRRNLKSIISLGESVSEPVTNSSDLPLDAALVRLLFSGLIVYLLPISLNPNSESGSDIADAAKLPRRLSFVITFLLRLQST